MQYPNLKISKLHSPDRVFSTVHALILEQLLVPKVLCFFCFCGLLQTPTFHIIFWLPRNTCERLHLPHYKTFSNVIQNLIQDFIYSPIKQFAFLLWFPLQRSFIVSFFSNVLIPTSVYSDNSFFLRKFFFVTLTSSNSKSYTLLKIWNFRSSKLI